MADSTTRPFFIRPLTTQGELRRCLDLQHETWGAVFTDAVPPSILKIAQRLGGVAAGAFSEDDRMLGFVFGLTGVEEGRIVHWSDMLAVREEARGLGIGTALKEWQREMALAAGATRMYWTFDPLVARNAWINLMKLGARIEGYVEDMYGESDSELHRGLGTDRFVVAWELAAGPEFEAATRARATRALSSAASAPTINEFPGDAGSPGAQSPSGRGGAAPDWREAPLIAIAVPEDILAVQMRSLTEAAHWRSSTRVAFLAALAAGFQVAAIAPANGSPHARYLLARSGNGAVGR
jgi:predicted GNAT superfamily acetyltransferase